MGKYALGRVLLLIPTLLGMSILIFLMLRLLPGDIVDIIAGATSCRQRCRQRCERHGLADPHSGAVCPLAGDLLQGDPRTSLRSGQPVGQLMLATSADPVELAVLSTLIATNRGHSSGVVSAVKRIPASILPPRCGLIGLSRPSFGSRRWPSFYLKNVRWCRRRDTSHRSKTLSGICRR